MKKGRRAIFKINAGRTQPGGLVRALAAECGPGAPRCDAVRCMQISLLASTPLHLAYRVCRRHPQPSSAQLEEISAVFAAMRPDDNMTVDYYAAKAALRGMGFAVRKSELLQVRPASC